MSPSRPSPMSPLAFEIAKVRPSIRVSVPVPARMAGSCRLTTSSARRAWSRDRKAELRAGLRHARQRDEREGGLGGRARPGRSDGRGRARAVRIPPSVQLGAREALVARRHGLGREPLRHPAPAGAPVDLVNARDGARPARPGSARTKPVTPSATTSGTEPRAVASTGVPHAMASIITMPKGSGQAIGKSSASAPANRAYLSRGVELAEPDDVGAERAGRRAARSTRARPARGTSPR